MIDFIVGTLPGAIMGLSVQAYWLIVFSRRPFSSFSQPNSRAGTVIVFGGLVAVGGWILLGGVLGLLVGAIRPEVSDAPLVPSGAYLLALLGLTLIALIPALVVFNSWKRHVLITCLMFIGLFGLLLPNLVIAVQE